MSHDAAMSVQHPQDVDQGHVVARYVSNERRYLKLLGGVFSDLDQCATQGLCGRPCSLGVAPPPTRTTR